MPEPIRVLIVDDQHLVRNGIRSLLVLSDAVEVVADCGDGDEALAILEDTEVDIILLDLRMPRRDGIATLEAMRTREIGVPVLVLTTFDDDELVLGALRAGAKGYLLKDVTLDHLLNGIAVVASGGTLLQPAVTDRLLSAVADRPGGATSAPHHERMTDRELDILRLAAAGWTNRQIAQALYLAEGTVKNRMSSVLTKLGVTDRTKAVLRALELGILSGDAEHRRGGAG